MKGRTMAYSTNGSSTHASALAFVDLHKVDAKLVATGGFPATFTAVMSGQIDAGWSAPPYAMEALRKGEIRVIARTAELPLVKGHTIRVLIASKPDLDRRPDVYRRFMRAYRETVDWMYASDEAPKIYAEFAKISIDDARRVREEFDPKEMLDSRPGPGPERSHARRRQVQISQPAADGEPARGPRANPEIARLPAMRLLSGAPGARPS